MPCASEITPDYDTCKAMVTSSTTMATLKNFKLYFDTCASQISTPFKEDFVTLNEDQTSGTLGGIAAGLTIRGTGNVKYIMLDDTGKLYTMMVETYWFPEFKHQLVSPQYLHTEEGNPMSFQTHC